MSGRPSVGAILALAVLSGAVALIYEIVFFRSLGLLFGVAIHAVAAVVTAFLGGLGLGAWLGGRLLAGGNPLRRYALLELLIGLFGLVSPWLFAVTGRIAGPPAPGAAFPAGTLLLSFLLLLWPTALMGATFPVLGRAVAAGSAAAPRLIGLLYGFNTGGAFLGTLLAATVLLPTLGLRGTSNLAAAGNVVLALAALGLAGRSRTGDARPAPPVAPPAAGYAALCCCAALVGFVALGLQILGTRLLISLLGASVYAFAAVLAVFLLGIAFGGAAGGGFLAARRRPLAALGVASLALGGAIGLGLLLLRWRLGDEDPLSGAINLGHPPGGYGVAGFLRAAGGCALLAFLPATLLSGAILPAISRVFGSASRRLSRGLGVLYGVNTLGSVAGSLAAAFLLLPLIGLRASFAALAGVAVVAALFPLAAARSAGERPPKGPLLAVAALSLAALAGGLHRGPPPDAANRQKTIYYAESPTAAVKVVDVVESSEPLPVRCLLVNGKSVASSVFIDRRLQLLLGFIPTLVHSGPRDILSIALGTGMSSGALAASGAESVEIVELSQNVIDACPLFDAWTGRVLEQANVTVYNDDGRAFLQRSTASYDLISADPIHPWVAGSAYLFTVEYYTLARAHLREDGLMSQWIPLYELTTADIAGIVATFGAVFPEMSAWVTGYDMVLLGSLRPLAVNVDRVLLDMRRPATRAGLAQAGVFQVQDLLACHFAGSAALRRLAERAPALITDDLPWIEFTAPLSAFSAGYATEVFRILANAGDLAPLDPATEAAARAAVLAANTALREAALRFAAAVDSGAGYGPARVEYSEKLRRGFQ